MTIWSTYYELTITDYTYTGSKDPGAPQLSEYDFTLKVCPWISDSPGWERTHTKTITISAPSGASVQKKTPTSEVKEEKCSIEK